MSVSDQKSKSISIKTSFTSLVRPGISEVFVKSHQLGKQSHDQVSVSFSKWPEEVVKNAIDALLVTLEDDGVVLDDAHVERTTSGWLSKPDEKLVAKSCVAGRADLDLEIFAVGAGLHGDQPHEVVVGERVVAVACEEGSDKPFFQNDSPDRGLVQGGLVKKFHVVQIALTGWS